MGLLGESPAIGRFRFGTNRAPFAYMTFQSARHSITAIALLFGLGLLAPSVSTQTMGTPERFTAFAVSLGGRAIRPGADTVQIDVRRWSSDSDRQKLLDALQKKGPEKLLDTLQDLPEVGNIRTPDSIGYPLHYAAEHPLPEGGRHVSIATDRPISFWEAVHRPRTIDYPFTLIELNIGPDGTGEGRMSVATKIIAHDNIVELENYEAQPVMLKQVKAERISH
jgi:hypothetical protein